VYTTVFHLKNLQPIKRGQGDQMIWKKIAQFFEKWPKQQNNAKIQTIFLNSLFWSKCSSKLIYKYVTIFGDFLVSKKSH
jgi:hypothetical protein